MFHHQHCACASYYGRGFLYKLSFMPLKYH
jgi:hypothetical protein